MYKNLDLMMSSYQKHVHYKESGKVMCKRKWLLYRLKTKIKEAPASVFLIAVKKTFLSLIYLVTLSPVKRSAIAELLKVMLAVKNNNRRKKYTDIIMLII